MALLPFGIARLRPPHAAAPPAPYTRPHVDWGKALYAPQYRPTMPAPPPPWPRTLPLPPIQQWLPEMQAVADSGTPSLPIGYPEEGLETLLARYAQAREAGYGQVAVDDNQSLHDAASWLIAMTGNPALSDPLAQIKQLMTKLPARDRQYILAGNPYEGSSTHDPWAPE